jgi:NAD(P)-dependent dehydrogenase (short-subunit alcohol dehydrogenase family)
MTGRLAIVTGGASGLGRAIAERLVAEGARVVIADVDEEAGSALAARLGKASMFRKLDVRSETDWAETMAEAQAAFGPLACLVNNAGISIAGSIAEATLAAWQKTMDVNATGTFLGCRAAVQAMREVGGVIINVASARGLRPSGGQVAYCASKALIVTLSESVAIASGENGWDIRCNTICPGVFRTPMVDAMRPALGGDEKMAAALSAMHLARRLGRPEEMAGLVAYLVSDEARFITGATFCIDGGFRIRDR